MAIVHMQVLIQPAPNQGAQLCRRNHWVGVIDIVGTAADRHRDIRMRLLVLADAPAMQVRTRQTAHDAFFVREMFHHEAQQLRQPIHENVKTAVPLPLSTTVATTAQGAATQGLHGLQQRHKLVVFRVNKLDGTGGLKADFQGTGTVTDREKNLSTANRTG